MAGSTCEVGTQGSVWDIYDTFEGMPEPTKEDDRRSMRLWKAVTNGSIAQRSVPGPVRDNKWSYAPLEDVRHTMMRAGFGATRFVKGKVEETLRTHATTNDQITTQWGHFYRAENKSAIVALII